jgi:hypothetical protein
MSFVLRALGVIGNIVFGSEEQTQAVLDAGFLKIIPRLLVHKNNEVHLVTALIMSLVALGNKNQLEVLFEDELAIHMLVKMTSHTC